MPLSEKWKNMCWCYDLNIRRAVLDKNNCVVCMSNTCGVYVKCVVCMSHGCVYQMLVVCTSSKNLCVVCTSNSVLCARQNLYVCTSQFHCARQNRTSQFGVFLHGVGKTKNKKKMASNNNVSNVQRLLQNLILMLSQTCRTILQMQQHLVSER